MADIQSVAQIVISNEHPVPQATQSVADMLRAANFQQANPETQIRLPAEPGYEHDFATINGNPGYFIKPASQLNPQITGSQGSNLMNSLPDEVGVEGATTERDINPDIYEQFAAEQDQAAAQSRDQMRLMAAAGAVAAVVIYLSLNTPKKRYS